MVISGWIIKFPYWLCWQIKQLSGQLTPVVFYVDSEHDYFIVEHILPHIEFPYRIVARNQKVVAMLAGYGIQASAWPAYPRILVMARHAFHRFPIKAIKKIGMKHGTYHFKKMIHPKKYNEFDLYLFTTGDETKMAARMGIQHGVEAGQPKLDAFSHPRTREMSEEISKLDFFDPAKHTLLFTTTWDKSGLSAIDLWIDKLPELSKRYNILVSLHPMMSVYYFEKIRAMQDIYFTDSYHLPASMLLADFLISDTSSVMGEFCALDKPIITFAVEKGWRLTPEIKEMIKEISIQIREAGELDHAVDQYQSDKELKRASRLHWRKVFYGETEGSQGLKAAKVINSYVKSIVGEG
ncbi:MAG: CDP-glycerol glycerophosphotransferase family protein [Bacteroidales bacterium]|nr:CDP-glycerol glycerophosphotransferase family protein [Bacteroidales bacterium]